MKRVNIGIVGGGYMGKAHSSAFASVGTIFQSPLKPFLHSICGSTPASSKRYAEAYGFAHAADNWEQLVENPDVDAVVIASPQSTHRVICEAAFSQGKHVLCEKPLGAGLEDARAMAKAAKAADCINMIGFNYMKTPVTQHAKSMVDNAELGDIVSFRATHMEDFLADPELPANWRTQGRANGNMGDLAPHIINHAVQFMGPIKEVIADISTVYSQRPSADNDPSNRTSVTNDDQASIMCHFANGVHGSLHTSRVATGKKMGIEYEIVGSKGALRFDQEDQNSLWYYDANAKASQQGFKRILAGPAHPDYLNFCQGPGHGTGYIDQLIIQAASFLQAIHTGKPADPGFDAGLAVSQIIDAVWRSHETRSWVTV